MEPFSQRQGFRAKKSVMQLNNMDTDLRISIWNALDIHYLSRFSDRYALNIQQHEYDLMVVLWLNYFKETLDTMPDTASGAKKYLREYFFSCQWFEVYDLIEFVVNEYYFDSVNEEFQQYCNYILERELSGYRFIGGKISPITGEEEIAEIEEALQKTKSLEPVITHLKSALDLFSDRESPDYRNSIKESISAVEAICRLIAGSKATLGKALGRIQREGKIDLHQSLRDAFDKLYGYTSDAEGIRHSLLDEPNLQFEDAKFMLVSCSAFINYLKMKTSKAGIQLESK